MRHSSQVTRMTTPAKLNFTHDAALVQIGQAQQLATTLCGTLEINSSHCSKSITLPVPTIRLTFHGVSFTFRDNFHDLNLLVESTRDIALPLSFFYTAMSFAQYMEALSRKRNYSYEHWTDAEMDDPRILRVKRPNGTWSEVRGDEKDRWASRLNSVDWYVRDWSGGSMVAEGPVPFTEETFFYYTPTAYAEGIRPTPTPYMAPCKAFLNCLRDWETLERICAGIKEFLTPTAICHPTNSSRK